MLGKATVGFHSRDKWLCGSRGNLWAPSPIGIDGNMTPGWTHSFSPLFLFPFVCYLSHKFHPSYTVILVEKEYIIHSCPPRVFFLKVVWPLLSPLASHLMTTDLFNQSNCRLLSHSLTCNCSKTVSAPTNRHMNILLGAPNQQNLSRQQGLPALSWTYTSGTQ